MFKLTPELEAKIKASGKPIIKISAEEFSEGKIISNEEVRKKLLKPLNK